MEVIRNRAALTQAIDALKGGKHRIGFVPTMGALHAGHLSLVVRAREAAGAVVASVFVNPTQFAPGEDFTRYPRDEAADAAMLEKAGADIAWFPSVADIYPEGAAVDIRAPESLAAVLCGAHRPGHFDGVATVVMRLFDCVRPDVAVFGEKDYQQLAIIRAVAAIHHPETTILGAPIIRAPDGLALSSRNAYLAPQERALAPEIHATLHQAAQRIPAEPGTVEHILEEAGKSLENKGFRVDYLELRHAGDLQLCPRWQPGTPARLFAAVWLENTRLIDNVRV